MESAAYRAVIEDLLVTPFPGADRDPANGRSDPSYVLVDLSASQPDQEAARAQLDGLVRDLSSGFGQPRTVALDGFLDPSVRRQPGPPLADVLADGVMEMYAWITHQRWLGVGLVRGGDNLPHLTAAVSVLVGSDSLPPQPADLAPASPESRVTDLVALTGWAEPRRAVDWTSVEERTGLALPGDYRLLAECFGAGSFDRVVDLHVPGDRESDLVLITAEPADISAPTAPHDTSLRLLQWASAEHHQFCWLVEGPDPEKWPVLARSDKWDSLMGPV